MRYPGGAGSRGVTTALTVLCVLLACEPPQPPGICSAIPQQTITVAESVTVSACFDDPNEDMLSHKAWSSDVGIATVTGSGAMVTVTAISPGSALVTVLAEDPGGLKAQQSFTVLVPNRPPVAVGEIANREIEVGDSIALDVAGYFREPDGQGLAYAATSDTAVAATSVAGAAVTVVAVAKGSTTVAIIATDPGGESATQSFSVTVPNRAPVAEGTISAQTVEVGDSATVDVSPFFSDPDGDELDFEAASSLPRVATADVSGRELTLSGQRRGTAQITIVAMDPEGLGAEQQFRVTVTRPPRPNRPPTVTRSIPSRTLAPGQSFSVDLDDHFDDPNRDPLRFEASSDNEAVASVTVSGSDMTVRAGVVGETTVAVIASDPGNRQATLSFRVTVSTEAGNRRPTVTREIAAQQLDPDETFEADLDDHFGDPDNEELSYEATSSNTRAAAATVSGTGLTVTAVANGRTTITATARDPSGLTASLDFRVTVGPQQPNQAPVVIQQPPDEFFVRSKSLPVQGWRFFEDPDDDPLVLRATTSKSVVATIQDDDATDFFLQVRARSNGNTTITLTAEDPGGLTAEASFLFEVGNNAPRVNDQAPPLTSSPGQKDTVTMNSAFRDDDGGDELTYSTSSSNSSAATSTLAFDAVLGYFAHVQGVATGTATVTMTARDLGGLSVSQTFEVTVTSNRPPRIRQQFPNFARITVGATAEYVLSDYFEDPDNDDLSYSAQSGVHVSTEVSDAKLEITGVSAGNTPVQVTASDPAGRSISQTFIVSVSGSDSSASH